MTKRAELAGLLEHHQAKARQLVIDPDAIDQALRLFKPDINLDAIKPKPLPPRHAAYKGGGVTIGLVAFFAAFRFIGAVRATMLSNIEPLLGVLFAVAVLGERLSGVQWTGVALAVAALTLFEASSLRRRPARPEGVI